MLTNRFHSTVLACLAVILLVLSGSSRAADGVFVRIKLAEPADQPWFVRIGGYIHNDPWGLPSAVWPADADKDPAKRTAPGEFGPWFDLAAHAKEKLHGRQNRAGGIAEFPNITAQFPGPAEQGKHRIIVELATAANEAAVVKRFEESFTGDQTSFLVSPDLKKDADSLETASQMTARRLAWAREASGGKRVAPSRLWVQTQFWSPQRPELDLQESEVLWLLGFNLVGNVSDEIQKTFPFLKGGGHHWIEFGPSLTQEDIAKQITKPAESAKPGPRPTLFGMSDEIACRPPIGTDAAALSHFRAWLKAKNIAPAALGVVSLEEVQPIESPAALAERQKTNKEAANRIFTWTTRFRHESANQRIKWLTEEFHRHAPPGILTTSLVADHPYFGGSGLGMGMGRENTTWGGFPLSLDWFAMARDRVVDVIGIEDWLGLEYMYGPGNTWEGFQLIGFQAAMMRSGSRGGIPIITWITPSDEKNLRLSASALCQGAKHFFYWTYGPTATSTENYWSDLRGAYDGIAHITRQLAAAEHIIAPGKVRNTRVALLYSLSSDLWQPFGYLSMAERRLTYFSLIHDQYLVDMVTEQDVEAGRLRDYDVLYVADPCASAATCEAIRGWVKNGGWIYGSCAAASRNEFGEPHDGLADVFGLKAGGDVQVQEGRFDLRGALNDMPWLDQIKQSDGPEAFGALGLKVKVTAAGATVTGTFADGSPAVLQHDHGKGEALYVATCPAVSYAKDARFVPKALKEKWPAPQREFINRTARLSGAPRLLELSHPIVEAGIYDAPEGTALILANFAYEPITSLTVKVPLAKAPKKVASVEKGTLAFSIEPASPKQAAAGFTVIVRCELPLSWNDILTYE